MKLVRTIPAAVVVLALLSGCLNLQQASSSSSGGRDHHRSTRDDEPELPSVIGLDAGSELAGVSNVDFAADFPKDPGILVLSLGGATTYEFSTQGCILDLRTGSLASLGITAADDDAMLTARVLFGYLGELAPDAILSAAWPVNGEQSSLTAVLGVGANEEGRPVIGVARAIGALDSYLYSEFSCSQSAVDVVYSDDVAPYLGVEILGD
jgi:hypothetical protein